MRFIEVIAYQLEGCIKALETKEEKILQPTNSDYTAALEDIFNEILLSEGIYLPEIVSKTLATRLNSFIKDQKNCEAQLHNASTDIGEIWK